jgi:hypothetical protein
VKDFAIVSNLKLGSLSWVGRPGLNAVRKPNLFFSGRPIDLKHILLPISVSIILVISCSFTFDLGSPDNYEIVTVEAAKEWNDTGIIVGAGDLLKIKYIAGEWSPWPGGAYDAIGSGGDPRCRCNVMDAVSHAALIGRIEEEQPFLVGMEYRHHVGESGKLYLGINDVDLYDNSGTLDVEITVIRK